MIRFFNCVFWSYIVFPPTSKALGRNTKTAFSMMSIVSSTKNLKVVYDYELNRFTNVTTFHGLIRLYQGRKATKIFWTFVVTFALSCFSIQCINSVKYLLSKPTVSQINLIVPDNGVQFPALTICNYNPVKTSSVAGMCIETLKDSTRQIRKAPNAHYRRIADKTPPGETLLHCNKYMTYLKDF